MPPLPTPQGPPISPARRAWLAGECLLLFFLVPPALYFIRHQVAFKVVPLVLLVAAGAAWWLVRRPGWSWRRLLGVPGFRDGLGGVLVVWALGGAVLTLATWVWLPERFMAFPSARAGLWLVVLLLYPVLAAYPQEVLFRGFFFERYQPVFPGRWWLIAANGLSFGLAHALYGNWAALVLSVVGGAMFAWRYQRTGSLLLAGLEHGLWGCFLFTVGLGWFFYSGSIH